MIKVKYGINFNDFMETDLSLLVVLHAHALWCEKNNKDLILTSIMSDAVPYRVFDTHLDGRAYDASVKGWSNKEIKSLSDYLTDNLGSLGAYGKESGGQHLVVIHGKGNNRHFHIQVIKSK